MLIVKVDEHLSKVYVCMVVLSLYGCLSLLFALSPFVVTLSLFVVVLSLLFVLSVCGRSISF